MTADFDYAEACIPDRWRVLGRLLLPFSVGHNLLFERIQSPFAVGGTLSVSDLILGVWICERPYAKGVAGLIGRKPFGIGIRAQAIALRSRFHRTFLEKHVTAFSNYIKDALRRPKVWTDSEAGKTYAPTNLILIRDLANHYGYTFDYIVSMPMRRALFERYAILEKDRTVSWPEPWEGGAQ